ncbi:hypothetical protein [Variovorax sp. RA8]|uniref:hypothetical protein n=1 Tax=Variovorax sp. (strain JCM 16519 / RA8) TaxID=662548 RepID=UPI00131610F4|nr:hypothetical protein [Variovorax sp. RA8]VTU36467.1 hypothetical protein RA8CHR_05482 [Variovorax sp. RA8]
MRSIILLALAAPLFFSSGLAPAQPATPKGPQAAASAPGPGGPGAGARGGMGPRFGRNYTPGWSMMSEAERAEHRKQMAGARTPDECRAVRDEHRKLMEQRAKERGMTHLRGPRHDACGGFRN